MVLMSVHTWYRSVPRSRCNGGCVHPIAAMKLDVNGGICDTWYCQKQNYVRTVYIHAHVYKRQPATNSVCIVRVRVRMYAGVCGRAGGRTCVHMYVYVCVRSRVRGCTEEKSFLKASWNACALMIV